MGRKTSRILFYSNFRIISHIITEIIANTNASTNILTTAVNSATAIVLGYFSYHSFYYIAKYWYHSATSKQLEYQPLDIVIAF